MFGLPHSAKLDKKIPKNTFYQQGLNTKLKGDITHQIKDITWAYKLSPETIGLPSTERVVEIEVFQIHLHTKALNPAILNAIDEMIDKPILFILTYEEAGKSQFQATMAYKRPEQKKDDYTYFKSPWQQDLTFSLQSLDLSELTENLIRQIAGDGLKQKQGESLKVSIDRQKHTQQLQKQIETLQTQQKRSQQLKEKLHIRNQIHALKQCIAEMDK